MESDTTIRWPTHFPTAVQRIIEARTKFHICSENWPYPTSCRLGTPTLDKYYAEIWLDGMDWTQNLWVVATENWSNPQVKPMMVFGGLEGAESYGDFNAHDEWNLSAALLGHRRAELGLGPIMENYQDSVWPFLRVMREQRDKSGLVNASFGHASQPRISFRINPTFVPDTCYTVARYEKQELVTS